MESSPSTLPSQIPSAMPIPSLICSMPTLAPAAVGPAEGADGSLSMSPSMASFAGTHVIFAMPAQQQQFLHTLATVPIFDQTLDQRSSTSTPPPSISMIPTLSTLSMPLPTHPQPPFLLQQVVPMPGTVQYTIPQAISPCPPAATAQKEMITGPDDLVGCQGRELTTEQVEPTPMTAVQIEMYPHPVAMQAQQTQAPAKTKATWPLFLAGAILGTTALAEAGISFLKESPVRDGLMVGMGIIGATASTAISALTRLAWQHHPTQAQGTQAVPVPTPDTCNPQNQMCNLQTQV